MLILMMGLLSGGFVRWVFFPDLPSDFIQANIQMEEGASNKATVLAMQQIEQALLRANTEIAGHEQRASGQTPADVFKQ